MALGARDGEDAQASAFELPAATTTVMPSLVAPATAASTAVFAPPPRLMLSTAGPPVWSAAAQLMPATTSDVHPEPLQSSTRTGTRVTPLATPYFVPPTVPATWVPWPLQSSGLPPIALYPPRRRPVKSLLVLLMPV